MLSCSYALKEFNECIPTTRHETKFSLPSLQSFCPGRSRRHQRTNSPALERIDAGYKRLDGHGAAPSLQHTRETDKKFGLAYVPSSRLRQRPLLLSTGQNPADPRQLHHLVPLVLIPRSLDANKLRNSIVVTIMQPELGFIVPIAILSYQ